MNSPIIGCFHTNNIRSIRKGAGYSEGEMDSHIRNGRSDIVEYHPWIVRGGRQMIGMADPTLTRFACWVDERRIGGPCRTLRDAAVFCAEYETLLGSRQSVEKREAHGYL